MLVIKAKYLGKAKTFTIAQENWKEPRLKHFTEKHFFFSFKNLFTIFCPRL